MFYVTRQNQWPEGTLCVEINVGGLDYSNPGALVEKFKAEGEGQEYSDPREAVEAGIKVAQAWQKSDPDEEIGIAVGNTGGYTMPFEGQELTDETFAELRKWAAERWDKTDKCEHCGSAITGKNYVYLHGDEDFKFCDRQCAENYQYDQEKELAEDEEEDYDEEHECDWGPVELSLITENPHRKCQVVGCKAVNLDLTDDDEEDDDDE